jgi:hypothetical protein
MAHFRFGTPSVLRCAERQEEVLGAAVAGGPFIGLLGIVWGRKQQKRFRMPLTSHCLDCIINALTLEVKLYGCIPTCRVAIGRSVVFKWRSCKGFLGQ